MDKDKNGLHFLIHLKTYKALVDGVFVDECKITYPKVRFPDKCVICGDPKEVTIKEVVSKQKLVAEETHININKDVKRTYADVGMEFEVPLCNKHKKEKDQAIKRTIWGLVISAVIVIVLFLIARVIDKIIGSPNTMSVNSTLWGILCVAIFAGVFMGAVAMIFIDGLRTSTKNSKSPLFAFAQRYWIELVDDNKAIAIMDLVITLSNEQVLEEMRGLNKGELLIKG